MALTPSSAAQYTVAEKTKLAGVATAATANSTDAVLKARANHTGTQLSSTISDFSSAVNVLIAASAATGPLVIGDGTNQTTVLRTALASARDSSTTKTVSVLGTVICDWHAYDDADADVPTLYAGCLLQGFGYNSVLKGRAATFLDGQSNYLLRRQENTTLRHFRVDGDAGSVGAITQAVGIGIYGKGTAAGGGNQSGVLYDTLWIHNFKGVTATAMEGFGIMEASPEDGTRYRHLRVWDIQAGSGIGGAGGDSPSYDDVEIWDCEWNGMALYANTNVQARGVVTHGCGFVGLNLEYSQADLHDCIAYDNGVNMRLLGTSTARAWGLRTWNGTTREIDMVAGNPGTGLEFGPRLELYLPSVAPGTGLAHLHTEVYPSAPTTGRTTPELVKVVHPDAPSWTITKTNVATTGATVAGYRFDGFPIGATATLGHVGTWSIDTGAATITTYAGSDDIGPNPQQIAVTGYIVLRSPTVLNANRTYLIRGRVKQVATTLSESIRLILDATGDTVLVYLPIGAGDVGLWHEFDVIVTPNAAASLFFMGDAGNTFVVDYLIAAEIAMQPGMGE